MNIQNLPPEIAHIVGTSQLTDTSGRSGAATYRIDRDRGYYLKIAEPSRLRREAEMTAYFARYKLSAEVIAYVTADRDYLVTTDIGGYSGITDTALSDPRRLCRIYGESLRRLHDSRFDDCTTVSTCMGIAVPENPLPDVQYTACVDVTDADTAAYLLTLRSQLRTDVMLHGDYCLPNILLDDAGFRGFIDLGEAGLGDRHFDLFWGIWSLGYNLKTNGFREYFLDCYGRDKVDFEMIRLCGVLSSF